MTTKRFKTKILAYQAYYGSGAYQRRYETRSLRVLTVTTSAPRAEHLKQLTEQAAAGSATGSRPSSRFPRDRTGDAVWQVATQAQRQPLVDPRD